MYLLDIPFSTVDWSTVERTIHPGETGMAWWRTKHFGRVRVRMVDYSPGYLADHWCEKGHVILVTAGTLHTELRDGRTVTLSAGMSYLVADDTMPHRSRTGADTGATLFIVD